MAHLKTHAGAPRPYEVIWSWYDESVSPPKRKVRSKRFPRKRDALDFKLERERAVADASPDRDTRAGKQTFRVMAEQWYDLRRASGKNKPSTLRGYRRILDASVLPQFGCRPLRSITSMDVERYTVRLHTDGLSTATIRRHYGVLSQVLKFAVRHHAIPINVAVGVELPGDQRLAFEPHFLDEDQVARLAEALDATEPYGLLIRFITYTGLRAGEVAGLDIGDIDMLRSKVNVRRTRAKVKASETNPDGWEVGTPKNKKRREVPMPEWLRDDLAAYLSTHPNRPDPNAPLWPGRVNGGQERFQRAKGGLDFDKPWERDAFYKRQFKPALATAGLPASVRLHDLRHTYVSHSLRSGIPDYRVAQYAGHSMAVMHSTYAHLLNADTADDMAKLARPSANVPGGVVSMVAHTRLG